MVSSKSGSISPARARPPRRPPATPVVSASDGAVLCASSFQALACAIAAFLAGHLALSCLAFLTFVLSVNYWSRPTFGAARSLDIANALVALVVSVHQALRASRRPAPVLLCYAAACGLFLTAAYRWSLHDRRWVWWHVAFHAASTAGNLLLYDSIS